MWIIASRTNASDDRTLFSRSFVSRRLWPNHANAPLDRPADRQAHPPLRPRRPADDLEPEVGVLIDPLVEREVVVLAVGEHAPHLADGLPVQPAEQRGGR